MQVATVPPVATMINVGREILHTARPSRTGKSVTTVHRRPGSTAERINGTVRRLNPTTASKTSVQLCFFRLEWPRVPLSMEHPLAPCSATGSAERQQLVLRVHWHVRNLHGAASDARAGRWRWVLGGGSMQRWLLLYVTLIAFSRM